MPFVTILLSSNALELENLFRAGLLTVTVDGSCDKKTND